MIMMFISLDLLRYKIEKLLAQFGLTELQHVKDSMVSLTSKNFIYTKANLIIVDVNSAGFDALEVIGNLRKGAKSKQLPILALGNAHDVEVASRLFKLGCTDYISKPFDDMAFASKVLELIRQHEHKQDPTSVPVAAEIVPESIKLTWNPSFEIGIASIDAEHRAIVENFEKLYLLMMSGQGHGFYDELLTFLTHYIETHFENEETFQKEIGYDHIEEHIKRHQFFKEKINSMITEHNTPISNADLIKLNLFIKDWLIQHILNEDKKLGAFYKAQLKE